MAAICPYGAGLGAGVNAEEEYVEAARVIGLPSKRRIMWRHILPNTLTPVLVISTVQVANAIMSEAALSFHRPGHAGDPAVAGLA
jgi:peptide/nickel transport system permease protein